jgi:hypothetical protein
MNVRLLLVASASVIVAAASVPVATQQAGQSGAPAAQPAVTVPAIIQPPAPFVPEGFTPLFNGKDLTGWHISRTNHHGTTPDYHVTHGVIIGSQNPLGRGGILLTDKTYKNVEVYLEIKPDWGCDSGLFLRSTEAGEAYQVTLDYLPGGGMGGIYGEALTGVGQPVGGAARTGGAGRGGRAAGAPAPPPVVGGIPLGSTTPIGDAPWMKVWKREDWNTVRARITGDVPHIVVWINDTQVTDFTDTANHAVGGATDGHIAIQIHGGTRCGAAMFWRWRTIAVKELP